MNNVHFEIEKKKHVSRILNDQGKVFDIIKQYFCQDKRYNGIDVKSMRP